MKWLVKMLCGVTPQKHNIYELLIDNIWKKNVLRNVKITCKIFHFLLEGYTVLQKQVYQYKKYNCYFLLILNLIISERFIYTILLDIILRSVCWFAPVYQKCNGCLLTCTDVWDLPLIG